jgi:hypothetical protein
MKIFFWQIGICLIFLFNNLILETIFRSIYLIIITTIRKAIYGNKADFLTPYHFTHSFQFISAFFGFASGIIATLSIVLKFELPIINFYLFDLMCFIIWYITNNKSGSVHLNTQRLSVIIAALLFVINTYLGHFNL